MCTLCLPKERIMKSPLLGTTSCCRTRPRGHGCGPMLERSASEVLIMEVVGTESRPHSLEVFNEREGEGVMPLYFIRHGESEANERNQFAGRQDSPLTRLGVEQAKQAGRAIARKGLVFDEMHVSPLQRARFTAQQIAEVSGNTAATLHVSDALLERHFGLLQGRNKSLWKKVLGYRHYDEMLHSPHGIPPDGEAWQELYHRVRAYYEQVLLPASQSGRTILVVLRSTLAFSLFGWNTPALLPIQLSALLMLAGALAMPALAAQWYRFRQPIKAGALSTNWGWVGGAAALPLAFLATYYVTPGSLVERVATLEGALLLGSALLLMAGAFGGLLLIARLVKVRGVEDATGRAQHLAATTPNVFLWSAMISPQFAHDLSSASGMLVMWAMLLFFVGLVLREQLLVRRVREHIALPLVMPWFEVTAKIATPGRV